MNLPPQANTAIRAILSIVFLVGGGLLPWLTPAHALVVVSSLALICSGVLALANLFHVPASVVKAIQAVLAVLGEVNTDIPSESLKKLKKVARVVPVVLCFVLPGAFLTMHCGGTITPPPAPVVVAGEQCAEDIITDVSTPVTPELITKTIADCGVAGVDIAGWVQSLLDATTDAGTTVLTRKGASVDKATYVTHLQQWLAAIHAYNQSHAGAQ